MSSPKLAPKPSLKSSRDADHEGDVSAAEPGATGPAEGELMVGRQTPSAEPVEEDGDAEPLGEGPQLLLSVSPVETASRP